MRTQIDDSVRQRSQRLADLENQAAELERRLSDARLSLQRELDQPDDEPSGPPAGTGGEAADGPVTSDDARTEVLVTHGRTGGRYRRITRRQMIVAGAVAGVVLIASLVLAFTGGGPGWPPSVAVVQAEVARACKNPDVASEPGQVNFACAPDTRQILWVFALLTSRDNPSFADARTGRMGLEPITPAQGGDVAWSLNLHHPYNPTSPVDSLEVAARAINNIIGGATVTGPDGSPQVQSGLEGSAANCIRYTGSAAMTSRAGFPSVCAQPVTVPAGQAALVSDVFQRWIVGAAPQDAQDAGVLFASASDPGSPQVQSILTQLRSTAPLG
jgi:hypothetical protein